MKKNIYVLLLLILFTLCLSSCKTKKTVYPPKDHIKVELEPEYSIYDDVLIDISIGLWKGSQKDYIRIPNFKYIVAYSKDYPTKENSKEHIILYTITDFASDKYYFAENGNEKIYNFKEKFLIKKEFFTDIKGEFYYFLYSTTTDFNNHGYARISRIVYEKNEEVFILRTSSIRWD